MGGQQSSVAFDCRIVAHRRGYEGIRLADVTAISKVPEIPKTNQALKRPTPTKPPVHAQVRPVAQAITRRVKVK